MNKGTLVYSLDEINIPVEFVYQLLASVRVVTLTGMMGAGKTTFVAALLEKCGVKGYTQSPTFQYVSRYVGHGGRQYYHFDLYRMHSQEQFVQEGFAEYLQEPYSIALIEWPEVIAPLLPRETCSLALDYVNEHSRRMRYEIGNGYKLYD